MRLDPEHTDEVKRIKREMTSLLRKGLVLPGTLTHRHTRCGRPGCRCGADPPQPHGPYWSWTRKVEQKTVTRYLSDDQYEDYRAFFDNARTLRALVTELEAVSIDAIGNDPRWDRKGHRSTGQTH